MKKQINLIPIKMAYSQVVFKMGEQIYEVHGIKGLKLVEGITHNDKAIPVVAIDFDIGDCAEAQEKELTQSSYQE